MRERAGEARKRSYEVRERSFEMRDKFWQRREGFRVLNSLENLTMRRLLTNEKSLPPVVIRLEKTIRKASFID